MKRTDDGADEGKIADLAQVAKEGLGVERISALEVVS